MSPVSASYRMVDFRMVCVFLLHLLVMLLLPLALLIIKGLQTFSTLVLLRHFIPLELLVAFLVKVLKVIGSLRKREKKNQNGKCCKLIMFNG